MNTPPAIKAPPTKVEGIRLAPDMWPKFRKVLGVRKRSWLEKLIQREYDKLAPEQQ